MPENENGNVTKEKVSRLETDVLQVRTDIRNIHAAGCSFGLNLKTLIENNYKDLENLKKTHADVERKHEDIIKKLHHMELMQTKYMGFAAALAFLPTFIYGILKVIDTFKGWI